jgi:hypothetical protein
MSLYETRPPTSFSVPNRPMFIKDRKDQTLFFLFGPRFAGYLVPDAQCERALRNAAARYESMQNSLAYFTVPLGTISIFRLDSRYGSFALTVLTITLVVAAAGNFLQRRWCFREAVAGLRRVEPLDTKGLWLEIGLFSSVVIAYCAYVVWRILQAFQLH